jgi:thiol-disulfide isomerase/thioredoxin
VTPRTRWTLDSALARAALAVVLLAAGAAALWYLSRDDAGSAEPSAYAAPIYELCENEVAVGEPSGPPDVGEPAPAITLCVEGAAAQSLADLGGEVVWVNFWATWCLPCRRELPDIQKLYDEKRDDGLRVLLVNVEDNADDAIAFLEERGVSMPVVLDRDGDLYRDYGLRGLPDSFFIDADGNVAALQYGFLTEEQARRRLADAGLP